MYRRNASSGVSQRILQRICWKSGPGSAIGTERWVLSVCVCAEGGGVRGVCVKQETGLQPRIPWLWHSEAEGESEQCLQNESRNQHLWNT